MDVDAKGSQVEFGELVGISKQAVSMHLKNGSIPEDGTLREWLLVYCEKLRAEASGRQQSDARERRDRAQAMESEANAQLKMRELYRQDNLIVDAASVFHMMTEWVALARTEFNAAIARISESIESHHGITIDREQLQPDIDAAHRAIGDYRFQPGAPAEGSGPGLDASAEDPND